MSHEKTAVPDDLLLLKQRLEEWRTANPPRTRLPERIWEAAVEMAQRHGLHCTTTMNLNVTSPTQFRILSPACLT